MLFEVRGKTSKEQFQWNSATFLEYFHAAKMCHLSIPLGQIRLGADQKRIFSHNTNCLFVFFYSSGRVANIYSLAVYDDTEIWNTSENYAFLLFKLKQWLGQRKFAWQNRQFTEEERIWHVNNVHLFFCKNYFCFAQTLSSWTLALEFMSIFLESQ